MLQESYIHAQLAQLAQQRLQRELSAARALAELPRRPSAARRLARLSGRALIEMGGRLLAYSAGPRPYSAPTTYSQN